MKKLVALILMAVMTCTLFAGCSDPVYDDLENFINVEMADVNANYDKLVAEASTWESLEEDADLVSSLQDVLLPLLDDSLQTLSTITPETEEVKALKNKYVLAMESYQEGFNEMLAGIQEVNEEKMLAGSDKVDEALSLIAEYNDALEALAADVGASVEY